MDYDHERTGDDNLGQIQDVKQKSDAADSKNFTGHDALRQTLKEKFNQSVYVCNLTRGFGKEIKIWKHNKVKIAD